MVKQAIMNKQINKIRTKQMAIRFFSAIVIFFATAYMAPNFNTESAPILVLCAFVTVVLDYLVATVTEIHDIPFGRAIVGFVSATLIIYMSQFIIRGYYISMLSSIIAAAIYGVIDYYLPNKT